MAFPSRGILVGSENGERERCQITQPGGAIGGAVGICGRGLGQCRPEDLVDVPELPRNDRLDYGLVGESVCTEAAGKQTILHPELDQVGDGVVRRSGQVRFAAVYRLRLALDQ